MEPTTETQKIIAALRKKLNKSGWNNALWSYWASSEFEAIIEKLQYYSSVDRKWIPGADNMFRFLTTCTYEKVKLVMLVDMTSVTFEMNDGIPMSCKNGYSVNKGVKALIDSIPGARDTPKPLSDLSVWSKQGVLMIPTALTAEPGKSGHYELWSPFISMLIKHINIKKPEVPWILLGTRAHEWRRLIKSDKVQERKFYQPFQEDGLWQWVEEQLILNERVPVEWVK